jgi:hypothetical protein
LGVVVFFVVCGLWWFCDGGLVGGRGIFEHPPLPLDFFVMDGVYITQERTEEV